MSISFLCAVNIHSAEILLLTVVLLACDARSIDELVNEIVISEPPLSHHGTNKVIVMNQRLATRVSRDDDTIERLLKNFQAVPQLSLYPLPNHSFF